MGGDGRYGNIEAIEKIIQICVAHKVGKVIVPKDGLLSTPATSHLIRKKNVYLTFDVDGFDSSLMPATGTPEPGGLFWDETLEIIKIAAKNSNLVGADINELAPIKGFNSYNFLVAKLAYKILSYKFLI